MMRRVCSVGSIVFAIVSLVGVRTVYAHGFGERYDLPIPLSYFLVGAAATVAVSFVLIGFFVKSPLRLFTYPRLNLFGNGFLRIILMNQFLLNAIKVVSVSLFLLIISTSLIGSTNPVENFSPTFIWIIWWVGIGYVAALVGNVWMIINPWSIIYDWIQWLYRGRSNKADPSLWKYPERLDRWPAVALFLVFAWLENVYGGTDIPLQLGLIVLQYSVVTWLGMIAFGRHVWLSNCEVFTVMIGFFARFSPTEVRYVGKKLCGSCELECEVPDGECVDCYACFTRSDPCDRRLNLRPYAVNLASPMKVTTATGAFVILVLSTVTFDGLTATSLWIDIQTVVYPAARIFGQYAVSVIDTVGLILLPLVFLVIYLIFCWAVGVFSGHPYSVLGIARMFVYSLVPISLAYNLAHYISLIIIQGQLIIPLFSDPFGFGWDLFGTAEYRLNINAVNARFVWYVSVLAIVLGHICSVYIAHLISIREMSNRIRALRSQYPMVVLMLMYTAISLWILAQPIINET